MKVELKLFFTAAASVADPDPGSGAFLAPGSGMGNKSGSGSGMNNPDHISESLETFFWIKILKFFDADHGSATLVAAGSNNTLSTIPFIIWEYGKGSDQGLRRNPKKLV